MPTIVELARRISALEREVELLKRFVEPKSKSNANANAWGMVVKSLRESLGMKVDEFSKLTGFSTAAIYLWEGKGAGAQKATMDKILAFARLTKQQAWRRIGPRAPDGRGAGLTSRWKGKKRPSR